MSCADLSNANKRISGKVGQVVDLNVEFYNNGVLADPYAIRKIEIYKTQVLPHNLVATIPILDPCDPNYPQPLCQDTIPVEDGPCCTEFTGDTPIVGKYHMPFAIPSDFESPDVYYDVWYYFPTNPCEGSTAPCDCELDNPAYESQLIKCCHRFWVYPNEWFCDDRLQTLRFGFEPLDQKFYKPEARELEVGLMPLPLYDFNYNLVMPIIPYLKPTITIETAANEVIVQDAECRMGIRQGSYRSNPFVIQYLIDTSDFLKGTYQYYIKIALPNGTSRVSKRFNLSIY